MSNMHSRAVVARTKRKIVKKRKIRNSQAEANSIALEQNGDTSSDSTTPVVQIGHDGEQE
jgi:hypothetical protein